MTDTTDLQKALAHLQEHEESYIATLEDLVRIPGISAWESHQAELPKSAEAIRAELEAAGLEHTELLELEGAPPYAYGEWLGAPGKPTVLLYAHHDVQPPGRDELWKSPPFEPERREGPNGLRLYGRGSADDKAGAMCHVAAIASWLKGAGTLPLNVKVIIEGEEEVGSTHLEQALLRWKDKLQADVIVLTDTTNFDTGVPSLTYSLRGLLTADVTVKTTGHAVHSGMWGGPCIDALTSICKLLGTLHDDDGAVAVEGFAAGAREPEDWEVQRLKELGYDEATLRKESGLLPGTKLTGEPDRSILERLWQRPTITVIGLDACPIATSANKLIPEARARLSCRLAAGQDPKAVGEALKAHLLAKAPYGAEVEVELLDAVPGWVCVPEGPAFDAAERALEAGFGHKTAFIGSGGSIPFVGPFAVAFGGAPAILLGLEDPYTNAHGENESLHLDDFKKLMNSTVRILDELSRLETVK